MTRLILIGLCALFVASVTQEAFAWGAVRGPAGGAAYRGPMGTTAVRGPAGGAAVRGPYGGAAVRGPYGVPPRLALMAPRLIARQRLGAPITAAPIVRWRWEWPSAQPPQRAIRRRLITGRRR
jgi:hypothetical protein